MLDSGSTVTRRAGREVPWLAFGPDDDIVWQVDQLTQETIGTTLAEEGWEPFSEDESGKRRDQRRTQPFRGIRRAELGSAFGYGGRGRMRRVGLLVCAAIVVIQLALLGYAVSAGEHAAPTRVPDSADN